VEKEPSEARRKKDNKQAEERKEKTSIQKHKTGKKKTAGIYTTRETNETEQTLHKPQTQDTRKRERETEERDRRRNAGESSDEKGGGRRGGKGRRNSGPNSKRNWGFEKG